MSDDVIEPGHRATIGRYQLLRKLAAGGMAEIYLARVTGVGGFAKNVVLKRILPQLAESEQFFRMFLDEARIAATLQHPNVIQVYDAGEVDGQYYIAMEFLDGGDLASIRRYLGERDLRLPIEHITFIASCVCAGLHYAHEKTDLDGQPLGIVHRDVTPQNIFVTNDGGVKLVDFGIAKASNRLSRTTYGTMKGKIAYMAPEQCQGNEVDRRADIYALGIVLYELATGANPHRAAAAEYAMMKEIVEGTIEPLTAVVPKIPTGFEEVVMKAVAKDPADRFQTAREMQMALEAYARSEKLPVSALTLSDFIGPILASIRDEAASRSERWASEVDAYEDYLHAKAAEGKRRKRNEPISGTADTEPALDAIDDVSGLTELLGGLDAEAGTAETATEKAPQRPTARPVALENLAPPIDIDGVNVRSGRTVATAIGIVAAAAAALAAYIAINQPSSAPTAEADAGPRAPTRPEIPERGVIAASSTPEGAAVWQMVGRTPVKELPVTKGQPLEIRVVHDGYQGVELTADVKTGDDIAPVELAPLDTLRRPKKVSWRVEKKALAYKPGESKLTITSEPTAAAVWVYAGTTPDVELSDVVTAQPHELRFELAGYAPAFLEVTERSFTVGGRAEVHPALEK